MSQMSYKRKVDRLLAKSDRMRFCNKVGLRNMCNHISKMYEYNFFDLYREIEKDKSCEVELLNVLRKDFISNLKILLKLQEICIKEKISLIIFAVSPSVYKYYFNNI